MLEALTTITNLINSPPGQFVAGVTLGGIVWTFFDRVEAVLSDDTKLEIAVWLLGVRPFAAKVEPWPETFTKVFDSVFGKKHLSWQSFWRCSLASYIVAGLVLFGDRILFGPCNCPIQTAALGRALLGLLSATLFDYVALLATRICLAIMKQAGTWWSVLGLILADSLITAYLGIVSTMTVVAVTLGFQAGMPQFINTLNTFTLGWTSPTILVALIETLGRLRIHFLFFPTLLTSIWLWLYAGSGFILKAARRFDIGFQWFNRRFDVEKKPLQSIGLVAGALVAVIYWAVAIASRIVG